MPDSLRRFVGGVLLIVSIGSPVLAALGGALGL